MSKTEQHFDEKDLKDLEGVGALSVESQDTVDTLLKPGDWTTAEERSLIRKLDVHVLLLLAFGFFCFQLERGNISNAASSTLFKDVGINQDQFNTGQGLLYLGIVLLEIPSQMAMQRLGPQKWLTFQVLCFGLVATLQLFMNNYASFLATRILLGVVECGYIPGSLYMLSTFYKRDELSSRTAWFFMGSGLVSGVGGLLAAGILSIKGSLKPWQYLFLIEGLMAVFCSLVFLVFLPDSPTKPTPLLFPRLTLFTARDREIMASRVVADDANKASQTRKLTNGEIFGTLFNWRNYAHVILAISLIGAMSALGTYVPLIIKGFGFDTIRANALSSVGGWGGFFIQFAVGWISDSVRNKGKVVVPLVAIYLVVWIAFLFMSTHTHDKWGRFASIAVAQAFGTSWHAQNAAWLSLNQRTPQQRAIAMAMFVMAANIGGIVGSQLLRRSDAPLYPIGFRVCTSLVGLALIVAIAQHLQYRWSNRQNGRIVEEGDKLREDRPEVYVY